VKKTWFKLSRSVDGVLRKSFIDLRYVADPTITEELYTLKPLFGDHILVIFNVNCTKSKEVMNIKRT
jgi:hypothetical protein